MKATLSEQKRACLWMIKHYYKLSLEVWDLYPDIADAYLVYDHYIMAVNIWEKKLGELCDID